MSPVPSMSHAHAPQAPNRPLRLAVLLQDLEFGGTQRYALQLLAGLDRALFTPELWVLMSGDDLLPEAQSLGVPITRVSQCPPDSFRALPPLFRQIARAKPDILYTLTVVPNIWGRIFGRMLGVPAIAAGFRELMPRQWEPLLWRCSDRLICNAAMLGERVVNELGVPRERVAVIPNCVDTERFRPVERAVAARPDGPHVVSVARLVRDKSPLALVAAFALAKKSVPGARLTMVGDGPLREQTLALAAELGVADALSVVTGCGEVRPHLAEADVFALASRREGSPNAVLEAMASGLPVVASRTGGLPDLVDDGVTGLLARPEDPQDIGAALARLLRDADLRRRMGAAGRERAVRLHSPQAMLRATQDVLLAAWNRRNARKGRHRRRT
jgi:glycosyltransferase involved in cell wall biosynthesis